MLVANLNNVHAQYGSQKVLKGVTFEINSEDRLGLIGPNGSGKTTMLKILLGEDVPSEGAVHISTGVRIGYVPQYLEGGDDELVMDWLVAEYVALENELRRTEEAMAVASPDELDDAMEAYQQARDKYDAADADHRPDDAQKVLDSLGLGGKEDQLIGTLSGGEKNVLTLALALMNEPDFLILDEPGNHLDFQGLAWLEEFLISFKGAVLIVSHNRHTLDRVATGILTLEDGKVSRYVGGYSDYRATRLRELIAQQADYAANQKRLAQLEALVKRLELTARAKASKKAGKRLRSRKSQLAREQDQAVEKPTSDVSAIGAEFRGGRTQANIVLQVRGYSKRFNDNSLLENVNLDLTSGERVAIIGPNGSGKTSMLRDIIELGDWNNEVIRIGPSIRTGYAAQQQEVLDGDRTLLEAMKSSPPESNDTVAFALLRNFLFTRGDLEKKVANLSGGERNRLQLATLMKLKPNFLILDEPTNHMDIPAREAIEEALYDFEGSILVVSHDRYFLDKIVDRVVELEDRDLVSFDGNFSEYWQANQKSVTIASGRVSTRGADRKKGRIERAELRADVALLEKRIEEAEAEKLELEESLSEAFEKKDLRAGKKLNQRLVRNTSLLEHLYDQWAVKA
ncbi:ribosomal protection-like ABC-F family protein [Candidatus Lucifugimonas marina]|uniref:ATP-binding cassette domain-containing protein n=1 Tax=Candidatus Lucifugimonas marina TaxID=3038979 RepID=A0AAJ5ZHR2_9CHLR|nr:ATP-binding cassette domain-containing protein [SAR202 cluster bacterium JH702]MDG0869683.1 ATP-binding cassette domain-containing protein [SAR202 cluster bacterium JH639]WFG34414.1 ATP-binding cassette domain-containing protein [SAR202 cluster bacterium JH545]WFG38343.1 ATP-binding cassette domain-containing protein [SAR202 cluster bacterium JH1073]